MRTVTVDLLTGSRLIRLYTPTLGRSSGDGRSLVAATRYTVEQCIEEAKGETGFDQYEVRLWPTCHGERARGAPVVGDRARVAGPFGQAPPGLVGLASNDSPTGPAQPLSAARRVFPTSRSR